jgi:protein-disulfide isomerase
MLAYKFLFFILFVLAIMNEHAPTHATHTAPKASNADTLGIVQIVLLVVILLLGLTGNFGGSMSSDGIKSAVTSALKEFDFPKTAAPAAAAPAAAAPQPAAATKIDKTELETFYKTAYILGPKDAKVTIIEFSDFECPFCKRHANNGTLDTVLKTYEGKVNMIFAHFPLGFHPLAQKAGEAAECVGKQGGAEAYYAFKKAIFNEEKPTREAIKKVTATLKGVDAAAVETCIDGGEFASKVAAHMQFGQKLGVSGTPGNIVMNNESGEFQKVSGAVPATSFDAAVTALLK